MRCVDFSSLSLGEALACFRPPLLRGVVRIPEVRTRLLEAGCYVSAKAIHREYYGPKRRVLLLEDKAMILWCFFFCLDAIDDVREVQDKLHVPRGLLLYI
ncbi:hypothetical protein JTE90_014952 [Oedothorax gibbosus]|uniref:Uncharacterized protein n=1 Tax=Oedothorax gibbosus TaxID=931172 RepID=A0AAV6V056_9ARAC|nr:hypothetical protein JTE90_014952 [Oedothorax gibbosus]